MSNRSSQAMAMVKCDDIVSPGFLRGFQFLELCESAILYLIS